MLFKHAFLPAGEMEKKKKMQSGEGIKVKGNTATVPVIKPF